MSLLHSHLPEDLAELSKEQLLGLKTTIEEELDTLALQMLEARANRATRKDWLIQAERASRLRPSPPAYVVDLTLLGCGGSSRAEGAENHFIAAAREVLPPEVFETVKNTAKQRQKDIAA
jgi:hypothetical protein